jgi:adenylosuccinate lyase
MLEAISPIDGRYASKTKELAAYFSEFALIKYRVKVEILYLIKLADLDLKNLPPFTETEKESLHKVYKEFSLEDGQTIKDTEKITNHDVKAVEYFVKQKLKEIGKEDILEFVHFGLTSQDINNTSLPMMLADCIQNVIKPILKEVINDIENLAEEFRDIPMLAKTHGQPASPTSLGKEFSVFRERLELQFLQLEDYRLYGKFGGATGNFNAHKVSFPNVDWKKFADEFVDSLGLKRSQFTTQIAHYDELSYVFDSLARINTILIDMCMDIWSYISMEYFKQKTKKGEIGSSTMPHKVNPIDFENAEGNLKLANAILRFLSDKLPVSRLQRDLTDSTVGRNVGVPLGHSLLAYKSIRKGLDKLILNKEAIDKDLNANWAVVAEAIQTIMRREKYPNPYEALKELTRGKAQIQKEDIHLFINDLELNEVIKEEMRAITPFNYTGYI